MSVEWREEPESRSKGFSRWLGREIWTLATRQHGLVSRRQLRAIGISTAAVSRWVLAGRLRPLHAGVYMVGHGSLSVRGHWMAAVLACGEGAALSHRSAARLQELIHWHPGRPSVSVPARRQPSRPGIAVHRIQRLEPVVVDAIPVTPVARTIVDLAGISRRRTLEKVIEEAHIQDVFDLGAIHETLAHIARPRGVRLLRSVLDDFKPGTTLTRSELEEAMLALCHRAGLPRPVCNDNVETLDGRLREVDFLWRGRRVIVETDSNRYHATHPKRRADRAKDRALQLAGYLVLRVPEEELAAGGLGVLADLRTALARRVKESARDSSGKLHSTPAG